MPDILKIIATPVALVLGALIGTWRNGLDPRRDLRLQRPTVRHTVIFTIVFVVLLALFELLFRLSGTGEPTNDWNQYGAAALALRMMFVGLVYPVAEEFFSGGFCLV